MRRRQFILIRDVVSHLLVRVYKPSYSLCPLYSVDTHIEIVCRVVPCRLVEDGDIHIRKNTASIRLFHGIGSVDMGESALIHIFGAMDAISAPLLASANYC